MPVLALVSVPILARDHGWPTDILSDTFGYDRNGPTDVPWTDIQQGCPRRDCIPAISEPRFLDGSDADYLGDDDLVMAVSYDGVNRAYPIRILDRHEIVNDVIADIPIAITFCPLCGSGLAYHRLIDGKVVEFGVSGLLHDSDLIMYDRDSESLWQQIGGTAFAGPLRGKVLKPFPVTITTWKQWRVAHPETEVLSPRTGYMRDYSGNAYPGYVESSKLMFPVRNRDRRLHPKQVVFGATVGNQPIAFDQRWLVENPTHTETVGGRKVTIRYAADGSVSVVGVDGTRYLAHRMFWFAWYTFNPDTELRSVR